ncbi:MAG: hypothetical protein WCR49_01655 [Opitutae bacterium]
MKITKRSLQLSLAALVAGALLFPLANTAFIAAWPVEIILSTVFSLGLLGLAMADYSRQSRLLIKPAPVLRPGLVIPSTQLPHSADLAASTPDRLAA